MKFSEKLRKIRTERDMSLAEFADLLGTSKQVLSRYERGDNTPKITTVQKYAEILNVPLAYLTDDGVENAEESTFKNSSLSDDEVRLLEMYRQLNPQGKEYILQTLVMATHVYTKNTCASNVESNAG